MFWGRSESLDLYNEYLNAFKKQSNNVEENKKTAEVAEQENGAKEENKKADEVAEQENGAEDIKASEVVEKLEEPKETHKGEQKQNDEQKKSTEEMFTGAQASTSGGGTPKQKTLNILLFGTGDPRHIIHSMAKLYKHRADDPEMPLLHFYMFDATAEQIARNLALLGIALEPPESLMLRNKVHLFMDVYGNTLMRPYSHQYLVGKTKCLLKMVSDKRVSEQLAPFIDVFSLEYRVLDGMVDAFSFWKVNALNAFNVKGSWEKRLRANLRERYDYRDGVFDWDLNMVLKDRGANQLCSQEYRYWRETGIAFTFPEYEQCQSNRTLSCNLRSNGDYIIHDGYLGEMETGPFAAFGLKSDDSRMTKSAHGTNDYRATDVTERNLLELFHEMQTGTPYEHNAEMSRKYGCVQLKMGKLMAEVGGSCDDSMAYDKPWIQMDGVKVSFLSADHMKTFHDKFGNFFDICFVGSLYFKIVDNQFHEVMRQKSLLLFETKLLSTERKDAAGEFDKKLKQYAKDNGYKGVLNYQALNGQYSVLKFKRD